MNTEQNARVALITGATGGLGPAVVKAFAAEGARLALSSRSQGELETLVHESGLQPDNVLLLPVNALDSDAVGASVKAAEERFGRLDVVVHVTGGFAMAPITETTMGSWELMIGLNLSAAFFVARAVLPGMLQRGSGKLIFVSSRSASRIEANVVAYAASKGGLETMVRDLAEEVRGKGVNVNAVSPSVIDTPANRKAMPGADYAAWVTPESIADVISFLASGAARDVHGAIIPIYGRA
ncbi:MAG: SDR family oxidoreductase [Chloroflexales bacterium]|nr:SDR family oxidoreductase [Chloroflexales bacterium]